MDFLLNHIHLEFPVLFIIYLITLNIVNRTFSKLIKYKWVFYLHYISVWIHELCHFIAAIVCLKIPKFNKIIIKKDLWKYRIEWSVNVKNYTYKSLINTLFTWDKVSAFIFLLWEMIAWFIIWLAPIIIPLVFSYCIFWTNFTSFSDIINSAWFWWLLLIPIFMLLSHISNVSSADIKHALPWIILLIFIKIDQSLIKLVILNMWLMLAVLIFSLVINLIVNLVSRNKYKNSWIIK